MPLLCRPMPHSLQPRAVFLVGFMGAGKTSVGRALAHRLGWRFIDLDDVVETRQACSIAEMFARSGENAFRQYETDALRELLRELAGGAPAVVALGGGAPIRQENADLLAGFGAPVIFLDAPFDVVQQRCGNTCGIRPLFRDAQAARQLYESRRPIYLRAGLRVDTASQSVDQAAAEIVRALGIETTGGH